MARTASAVLSPADKKAALVTLKAEIKSAKDNVKQLAGIRKEIDKTLAAANKAHLAALKVNDKGSIAAAKTLAALEAKLPVKVAA